MNGVIIIPYKNIGLSYTEIEDKYWYIFRQFYNICLDLDDVDQKTKFAVAWWLTNKIINKKSYKLEDFTIDSGLRENILKYQDVVLRKCNFAIKI